jgi:hypothetical protein
MIFHAGRLGRAAAAAALTAFLAAPASAGQTPSLAEVAKKEQERRKATKPAQKVLTNKDLPESAKKPLPAPTPGATTEPSAAAPAQKPGDEQKPGDDQKKEDEQKEEAWWRARITQAREDLRRNEVFLEALQSRVNALSADFVNRDDPYQRAKIGEDRQKALAETDRVKVEIAEQKKKIEDIEEEARKAGVPPGWLR